MVDCRAPLPSCPGSPGMTSSVQRLYGLVSGEHAHDVALLHDQEVLAGELDLGARPFAEQHAVADLEVDWDQLAGFVTAARTDRGDFALRGLFLGGVWNDDAALGLFFGFDSLDHDTVMQRTKFGFSHEGSFWRVGLSVGFDSGSEHKAYSTLQGAEQLAFFGNHTLGVLIVRPGIWLDAAPVKQTVVSRW